MIEAICRARQFSDMMTCSTCELQWDTNDSEPPVCPLLKAAYERSGEQLSPRASSGWAFEETPVSCPLCDDAPATRSSCFACCGVGRVTAARFVAMRRPVPGRAFDRHWVVISAWRWKKGLAEDFKTRDGKPPFLHGTELSATLECKRLSQKHPGKRFVVYSSGYNAKVHRAPELVAEQDQT